MPNRSTFYAVEFLNMCCCSATVCERQATCRAVPRCAVARVAPSHHPREAMSQSRRAQDRQLRRATRKHLGLPEAAASIANMEDRDQDVAPVHRSFGLSIVEGARLVAFGCAGLADAAAS